ncbi:MAG: hypothetical protein JWR38_3986 [Mucilaginibacter sp.]|nr:hypothetical protein [Mucilaginibacter sp.]
MIKMLFCINVFKYTKNISYNQSDFLSFLMLLLYEAYNIIIGITIEAKGNYERKQ